MTRFPERISRDAATIRAIFDEALIVHVALATEHGPIALPTIHARIDDENEKLAALRAIADLALRSDIPLPRYLQRVE